MSPRGLGYLSSPFEGRLIVDACALQVLFVGVGSLWKGVEDCLVDGWDEVRVLLCGAVDALGLLELWLYVCDACFYFLEKLVSFPSRGDANHDLFSVGFGWCGGECEGGGM